MGTITHAAERKAFEVALNAVVRKTEKGRRNGYVGVVNAIEAVLGDGWKPEAYDALREAFGKEGKWAGFMDNLLVNYDADYIKGLMMSLGYEGGFSGFRQTKRKEKELGIKIPWIILFDPTSACNLHCAGCWASEYKKTLNLSYEDMNNLVCQGKELGVHEYLMFVRLQHAALDLVSTGDSITEIALRSGFSDSNYFKDAFKKKYGVTPSAYRKNR